MKYITFFIIYFIYVGHLHAQSLSDIQSSSAQIKREIDKLSLERDKLKRSIDQYYEKVEEQKKIYNSELNKIKKSGSNLVEIKVLNAKSKAIKSVINTTINELKGKVNKIEEKLTSNIEALRQNSVAELRLSENKRIAEKELLGNFINHVKNAGIYKDITNQELRLNSIDDELNALENLYDKTYLGAYFRDKIGRLLNSKAFCKARESCLNNPVSTVNSTIINKLFPETVKTRVNYSNQKKGRQ